MLKDKVEMNTPDIYNFLRGLAILCVFGVHSLIVIRDFYPDMHFPWVYYTPAWAAMWMFFILSGYLLGKGFYNNKYKTDKQGIINFYISRAIRILIPYFLFILIMFLFVYPEWFYAQHFKNLIPLLTFTYSGGEKLGALWFVSTIVQLYLLAPFVYKFILSKINCKKFLIFFLIIGLGLGLRLIQNSLKLDYYLSTYVASWSNLDLFFGGMFLNAITQNSHDTKFKKIMRPVSILLLFLVLILCTYQLSTKISWFYKYICPTIFFVIMSLIIYSHDYKDKVKAASLNLKNIIKNPIRLIEGMGLISFSFYLYHSYILSVFPPMLQTFSPRSILIISTILGFAFSVIWAVINYFAIEKPLNKYRTTISIGKKHD